jgi:hypothetical protein
MEVAPMPPGPSSGSGAACFAEAYASAYVEHLADAQRSGVALELLLLLTPSISLMLNAQASLKIRLYSY